MNVRKHNAAKITETFEYDTITRKHINPEDDGVMIVRNVDHLKGFQIAGGEGKVSLTYDERDKQQVVILLRLMADQLEGSGKTFRVTIIGDKKAGEENK